MEKRKRFGSYRDCVVQVQPAWIMSILGLKIYPVSRRDGSKEFTRLTENIFVPNSPRLNSIFRDKVDRLDFNRDEIYPLIPLLKFGAAPVKYLLSYDNDADIEIPAARYQHDEAMALLVTAKAFIARYSHNDEADTTKVYPR
jgi:hypothetical protein